MSKKSEKQEMRLKKLALACEMYKSNKDVTTAEIIAACQEKLGEGFGNRLLGMAMRALSKGKSFEDITGEATPPRLKKAPKTNGVEKAAMVPQEVAEAAKAVIAAGVPQLLCSRETMEVIISLYKAADSHGYDIVDLHDGAMRLHRPEQDMEVKLS